VKSSRLLFILLVFPALPSHSNQHTITLFVDVIGANPGQGQIILSVFSSNENYLKVPISSASKSVDGEGSVNFEFTGLPAGRYALSAIYDEDNNDKLNTGMLGIPTELVGFSNDAKGIFGPPDFDKAALVAQESQHITISLEKAKN